MYEEHDNLLKKHMLLEIHLTRGQRKCLIDTFGETAFDDVMDTETYELYDTILRSVFQVFDERCLNATQLLEFDSIIRNKITQIQQLRDDMLKVI